MTPLTGVALVVSLLVTSSDVEMRAQVSPPRDGDIRVVYLEALNQTEVWLTLEPKSAVGKPAPPGMNLTFTHQFAGKRPVIRPADIVVRAYVGLLWAPQVEFWLALDRSAIMAPAPEVVSASGDGGMSHLQMTITIEMLRKIAHAKRVEGNALGLEFELSDSQRRALRVFLDKVVSDNPSGFR